jgi:ribosome biogenesis protein SSF1/2
LAGDGFQSDASSDSEPEDDPNLVQQLPDKYVGKGNHKSQKSALKLVEIGPRLSLELIKVEKGLGAGDVLYHALVKKTPEEAAALKARKEGESALKQETNVERERKGAQEKREFKRNRLEERDNAAMDDNSSTNGEESSAAVENVDE